MFANLLKEIQEKGIEISIVNGKLSYAGPDQYITEEFLKKLIANKSKLIKHYWPQKDSNLLPLNPEGSKKPIILVHGERGNYFFNDMLDQDQPFYGFLHLGSDGEPVKLRTVEEFADEYIKQLLNLVPRGPIVLGGFSFGGIIAFEMACKLKQLGHEVAMLVLVDCISPYYKRRIFQNVDKQGRLKGYSPRPFFPIIERKIKLFIAQFFIFLKLPVPASQRSFYILANYTKAFFNYKPGKYDGDILLFKAKTNDCEDCFLGWNKLVNGKIELINFDGDHMSIIEDSENAKLFVKKILQKMGELT